MCVLLYRREQLIEAALLPNRGRALQTYGGAALEARRHQEGRASSIAAVEILAAPQRTGRRGRTSDDPALAVHEQGDNDNDRNRAS